MLGQPVSMLIPQVVGFKLSGKLPGRRDRDRPRAHRHADAPQEGRGREVRRVLRPGPGAAAARRPRHDRQHGPRVRGDVRHLPGRRRDAALPDADRPAGRSRSRWSRRTTRNRGCSTTRTRPRRPTPTRWNSTSRPWSRAWPARAGRRTASPLTDMKKAFAEALPKLKATAKGGRRRHAAAGRGRGPDAGRRGVRRRPGRSFGAKIAGSPGRVADRRLGRHRRDHELHEHVEPVGDDRRRPAGARRRSRRGSRRKPWVKTSLAPARRS